jgi:hypothetical protein
MANAAHHVPAAGFFGELRRRRVLPVAAVFLVGGGLLLELSGFLLEQAAAPGWIGRLLAIAFVVGFAVAVVIAWVVRREPGGGWALDSSRGQRRTVPSCHVTPPGALSRQSQVSTKSMQDHITDIGRFG